MRKFTKEISVLLATAAIGAAASAGNVSASTEENLMSSEGVLTISDEDINDVPVAGGLMADPYLHEEITTEPTSEELLPPTAGEPMPPDYLIEPTTEEFLPPTAGVPMLPDDDIEPTNEWLPPLAGDVAVPDGDINADGSINMADLVMLQKWLFNKEGCDDCEMWRADFTHDGVINVFDLVALRQEIVRSKKIITMDDIRELAKKGFDLKVSDFDKYQYTDIGSGLCINNYDIADGNGRFEFIVGHAGDDKIVYARLKGKSSGETIDIREEDVEFFYAKNNPPA